MMIRLSKIAMVLAMALFASLVSFGNITDYETNFAFVHHVFLMDTTFPGNSISIVRSNPRSYSMPAIYLSLRWKP